jgi:limonene-1,2-epoxide hydrolase
LARVDLRERGGVMSPIRTVKGDELKQIRNAFKQNDSHDVETSVKLVRFTADGSDVLIERNDGTTALLITRPWRK